MLQSFSLLSNEKVERSLRRLKSRFLSRPSSDKLSKTYEQVLHTVDYYCSHRPVDIFTKYYSLE